MQYCSSQSIVLNGEKILQGILMSRFDRIKIDVYDKI